MTKAERERQAKAVRVAKGTQLQRINEVLSPVGVAVSLIEQRGQEDQYLVINLGPEEES